MDTRQGRPATAPAGSAKAIASEQSEKVTARGARRRSLLKQLAGIGAAGVAGAALVGSRRTPAAEASTTDTNFVATGVGGGGSGFATSGGAGFDTGVAAAGTHIGVYGSGDRQAGVYGTCTTGTGVFGVTQNGGPGVYGIGSQGSAGVVGENSEGGPGVLAITEYGTQADGVHGITSGNGNVGGVHGESTGSQGNGVVGVANNGGGAYGVWGYSTSGYGGVFYGPHGVFVAGPLTVTGAKSAAVRHPDGTLRRLYAVESPESWFEDFGTGALTRGAATIQLAADFAAVVQHESYYVFLTAEGESQGLYVSSKGPNSFVVREAGGGTGSIAFSYRVVAKRKDIEGARLELVPEPPDKKPAAAPALPSRPQLRGRS